MTDERKSLLIEIARRIEANAAKAVVSGSISESSPRLTGAIRIAAHLRVRAADKPHGGV